MTPDFQPHSHAGALAGALLLALTASNNEQRTKANDLVQNIASQIDDQAQLDAVQDSVEACIAYFSRASS